MTVSRVYDPAELNKAVNMPGVLEYVAPDYESYDLTKAIVNRQNIVLRLGDAFGLFIRLSDGIYEGHFLHPQHVRGKLALECSKMILNEMFTIHGADVIGGPISRSNRAARVMARALGLKPVGESRDPLGHECIDYAVERTEWVAF